MADDDFNEDSFFDDVDRDFSSDDDPETVTEGCPASKDPNKGSKTTSNTIDLVFDPDTSDTVTKCDKIVHVQFVQMKVDNKVVKAGDLWDGWKYRDKVTTSDGWAIDFFEKEKTPDYQQGKGDGKKNGGSAKATMWDGPDIKNHVPGGFYDPFSNKKGTMEFVMSFATFAWCMKGPDCGKWYEGVTWQYRKTWADHKKGDPGTSSISDANAAGPTAEQIKAFDLFNKEKGFKPC